MKRKTFTVSELSQLRNESKQKTAIYQLLESLDACKRLGCKAVQIEDIITHIQDFEKIEIQQMKKCFVDGREFQADEENKNIPFSESANRHIENEYNYYIKSYFLSLNP